MAYQFRGGTRKSGGGKAAEVYDDGAGNVLESDEEDEDFVAEKDDAGSPTGDTDEEGSDASEGGDGEVVKSGSGKVAEVYGGVGNELDSDVEDEDFVAEKDDAGSPTGDTDEEGSDASEDGDGEKSVKEKRKEPAAPKPAASKKKRREDGVTDGKKKRRKRDPNAPKRAMSSFMYFSQAERAVLKKTTPGLAFKDVAKVIGERWKKLSKEEKEPYENSARLNKARYIKEMVAYKSRGQTVANESSGEESD